jgi:hypothetical protein
MSREAYIVDEAIISIFPLDVNGAADTANPIWFGEGVTGLRFVDTLVEVKDYPTGVPYGKVHHVDESHDITIERLWEVDVPAVEPPAGDIGVEVIEATLDNGTEPKLRPDQEYIMSVVWQNKEDPTRFHWRVYYGVTDVSQELSGVGNDGAFNATYAFRAQRMVN